MNITKSSGPIRLIAFFLVAIIMVCTFGFAADGWKLSEDPTQNQNDSSDIPPSNQETGEGNDPEIDNTNEPIIYIPDYVNFLTGLETTAELSSKKPTSFVLDSSSPIYGISGSDVVVEIPVDNESTRLISITTDLSNLWKIGSLASGRKYISNIAAFFGTSIISSAHDDTIIYDGCEMNNDALVFSEEKGFCYSEYSYYLYTNVNLVNSAMLGTNIDSFIDNSKALPYKFIDFGEAEVESEKTATNLSLIYSSSTRVELSFSVEHGEYFLKRNGSVCKDLLNSEELKFKNCFILFADSVTYEGTNSSQTIINTIGEGIGYYITNGTAQKIKWHSDIEGNLFFTDLFDTTLTINRGKIYVGFLKSSRPENLIFS